MDSIEDQEQPATSKEHELDISVTRVDLAICIGNLLLDVIQLRKQITVLESYIKELESKCVT